MSICSIPNLRLIAFTATTVIFLSTFSLYAIGDDNPPVIEKLSRYDFTSHALLFADNGYAWKDIVKLKKEEMAINSSEQLDLAALPLPAWVRIDVHTGGLEEEKWFFDMGQRRVGGKLSFYVVNDGRLITELHADGYESFYKRPFQSRFLIFPVELSPNRDYTLLLKVEKAPDLRFTTQLVSREYYLEMDKKDMWLIAFETGFIFSILVFHLILTGVTRDGSYLAYSAYLAATGFFLLHRTGYGYQYIWPNLPTLQDAGLYFHSQLPTVTAIVFSIFFLKLEKLSKSLTKAYWAAALFLCVAMTCRATGVPFIPYDAALVNALIYLSFIGTGVYALKRRVVYARYYLIAWTLFCLAVANWLLGANAGLGILTENRYNIMIYMFDVQVLMLGFALAHRIRLLRSEKVQADADNRAKSVFLARMSHEIRTPLSGVLGMAELLADRLKDGTDIYYNNIIRSSGSSLLTIINDILDYSKFTSGKMELESIPFNLHRLAMDCMEIFKVKAAEQNLELIANIDDSLPTLVQGDPTRVKQIILNFISNAIKFTHDGHVMLSVSPHAEKEGFVRIAVSDTGIGMTSEEKNRLFEAFSQTNKTISRQYGGTGLGLAICKQLVLLMGGDIGVDSKPAKGSTFWLEVPLPRHSATEEIQSKECATLEGKRILIVEDNHTFADILETQVTLWGMDPVVCHDGEEALASLDKQYCINKTFDIMSIDLLMPGMNGMELSHAIKKDKRFCNVPRLLLTSSTSLPSIEQIKKSGIGKVVEKPVIPSELSEIFQQLLTSVHLNQVAELQSEKRATANLLSSLRVLVVEDNEVNRIVIKGTLEKLNQTVELVNDGEDAVRLITKENRTYDLVLMDCEMERMGGIEATKFIRKWELGKGNDRMKIVALTAHAIQSQIELCLQAGMDSYLTKPLVMGDLRNAIEQAGTKSSRIGNDMFGKVSMR